jgi:hypothetical protein
MISHAISTFPEEVGSLKDICSIIAKEFQDQLNWKLER